MKQPKRPRHESARRPDLAREVPERHIPTAPSPDVIDDDDDWDLADLEEEARGPSAMAGARERLGKLMSASKRATVSAGEKIAERRRSSSEAFSLTKRREEKSKARRKTWLKRGIIGLVLGIIIAALVWLFFFSNVYTIEKEQVSVEVTDPASVISGETVYPILDPATGTPTLRVDEGSLKAELEKLPEIAHAEVATTWPHGLTVHLTAVEPVACLTEGDTCVPLTADGVRLPRIAPAAREALPKITMDVDNEGAAGRLNGLVDAIGYLPQDVIAQLDTATMSDTGLIEFTVGSSVVKWGTATLNDKKAEVLAVLITEEASVYDVSVPSAPVTR